MSEQSCHFLCPITYRGYMPKGWWDQEYTKGLQERCGDIPKVTGICARAQDSIITVKPFYGSDWTRRVSNFFWRCVWSIHIKYPKNLLHSTGEQKVSVLESKELCIKTTTEPKKWTPSISLISKHLARDSNQSYLWEGTRTNNVLVFKGVQLISSQCIPYFPGIYML